MENFPSDSDLKDLVRKLCEGKELAQQLQNHLNLQSSSSHESREFLLQRIMSSYDHALSMLARNDPATAAGEAPCPAADSPWFLAGSPQTDDSDQDFADQASRKRKGGESEKVKVRAEIGGEGQLDDGYAWRKYGQKDILGAKHPRSYYRCTYKHGYGCLATKYVQRSDEDPTIFEITYRRKHTCNRASDTNNPPLPIPEPQNEDPNPLTHNPQNDPPIINIQTIPIPIPSVSTPHLGTDAFKFSSSSPIIPQNNFIFSDRNDVSGNYYPFLDDDYGELIPNLRHLDSELSPIVAAMTTSTTNSTPLDPYFPFGPSGFGSDFDFGKPGH